MSDTLRADASHRAPTSFEGRPSARDLLGRAAHESARLGSAAYDRLARFAGEGTRTLHLGVRAGADRVAASAVSGFERAAGVAGRAADRTLEAGAAVPRAFRHLSSHVATMRVAAAAGVRDGVARADGLFRKGAREVGAAAERTRSGLRNAAAASVIAVAAFAASARESRPAAAAGRLRVTVADEAVRLRRWAEGTAAGAVIATRLAAEATVLKVARAGRFFSDGALAIQVGATESIRRAAQSRHLRMAGYVAGVGGLAALSFGAGMHAGGVAAGVSALHANLPDPLSVASAAANGTWRAVEAQAHAGGQVAEALAHRAATAGTGYWHQFADALGRSGVGHDLVRVAGHEHASGIAEAFAEPAKRIAHAHAHAHLAHVGHVAAAPRFGDQVADSLNAAELLRIKLDALRSGHQVAASLPDVPVRPVAQVAFTPPAPPHVSLDEAIRQLRADRAETIRVALR